MVEISLVGEGREGFPEVSLRALEVPSLLLPPPFPHAARGGISRNPEGFYITRKAHITNASRSISRPRRGLYHGASGRSPPTMDLNFVRRGELRSPAVPHFAFSRLVAVWMDGQDAKAILRGRLSLQRIWDFIRRAGFISRRTFLFFRRGVL